MPEVSRGEGLAQCQPRLDGLRAGEALGDVALDVEHVTTTELAVGVGLEQQASVVAAHGRPPLVRTTSSCRALRARASLDITVPSGRPQASAISRYDNPSISRSTIISR